MKLIKVIMVVFAVGLVISCKNDKTPSDAKESTPKDVYTCPMPEDSVFSDKPGNCPKCGMDLVKMEQNDHKHAASEYTCPMHPEIVRDKPGSCPICGMDLVKKETGGKQIDGIDMESTIAPTNEFVLSAVPVTTIQNKEKSAEVEAFGRIEYDARNAGSISSRVAGRIEKLFVRFRYQKVTKGQHILDIYSPELLTAQQNLLFLLKNDRDNGSFIQAAKDRLLLLGMSEQQLNRVIQSGKPAIAIAVYSNYSGHIHEAAAKGTMNAEAQGMRDISLITEELSLKEGMYLQKGQSIFTVFDPAKASAILDIYGENQSMVNVGNAVRIAPETAKEKDFRSTISYIEPFYRKESKTLAARVYFNNSSLKIPIGSQVKATIFGDSKKADWLPKDAVVSLGLEKIVFEKKGNGFMPRKVKTGIVLKNEIQILDGITATDSVAVNAQYLMDSESFIKVKN